MCRAWPPRQRGQAGDRRPGQHRAAQGRGRAGRLSRRLARDGEADLVLIGNLDPATAGAARTDPRQLPPRRDPGAGRPIGISCWLRPSVWPETFSFATHEVLATGLPVYCFDLGAQGRGGAPRGGGRCPGAAIPLPAERARR